MRTIGGMKVLLVGIDRTPPRRLVAALREHAQAVESTQSDTRAIWVCRDSEPAVTLAYVDTGGPPEARFAARLRDSGSTTPLIVMARRARPADVVAALDAGADDYVVRPVRLSEVAARLRALSRRGADLAVRPLSSGDLRIDLARGTVTRAGTVLDLPARQVGVLTALVGAGGRIVSRAELLDAAWDPSLEPRSNVVDQTVAALRRAVDTPFARHDIVTVRGRGYRWAGPRTSHG